MGNQFFSNRSPERALGGPDLNRGRQLFLAGAKHRGAVDNGFVPIRKFRCSDAGPETGYPITFFSPLFFLHSLGKSSSRSSVFATNHPFI